MEMPLKQVPETTEWTKSTESHQITKKDEEFDIDTVAMPKGDVILDYNREENENIIQQDIVEYLYPHQVDGVKFMFDVCYRRTDAVNGCILAHCMGLGKTPQVISLIHTVITHPQYDTNKVLIICPKSTILNWESEIKKLLSIVEWKRRLNVHKLPEKS